MEDTDKPTTPKERKRYSEHKSTFAPTTPATAQVITVQQEEETTSQQAIREQQIQPEEKVNNLIPQKVKDVKETKKQAKEEKGAATEKMSLYITPEERAKYRKAMREMEDKTGKRLDENKFFRLILKHLDTAVILKQEAEN